MKPKLAISMGDPAGIGPEIIVASLDEMKDICIPTIFGHWASLEAICRLMKRPVDDFVVTDSYSGPFAENLIQFVNVTTGISSPATPITSPGDDSAHAQLNALAEAVTAIERNHCDALVTAPVSKEVVARIAPGFTGHTEYLAERSHLAKDDVTMVFATPRLVVGLISTHVPLARIPETINEKRYSRTLRHVIETVKQNTGKTAPRIAVAGLNPHAGEGGLLGKEEIEFIEPFCKRNNGLNGVQILGPIPADAVYRDAFAGKYDGVIAAYHDQALIPLKLSGFGGATNVTAGLPFIRTSPDHGTAYEIARKQIADASAMKTAIQMAVRLQKGKVSP